jgi:hypothetical protein
LAEATALLDDLVDGGTVETDALLAALDAHGFRWGKSDGN